MRLLFNQARAKTLPPNYRESWVQTKSSLKLHLLQTQEKGRNQLFSFRNQRTLEVKVLILKAWMKFCLKELSTTLLALWSLRNKLTKPCQASDRQSPSKLLSRASSPNAPLCPSQSRTPRRTTTCLKQPKLLTNLKTCLIQPSSITQILACTKWKEVSARNVRWARTTQTSNSNLSRTTWRKGLDWPTK